MSTAVDSPTPVPDEVVEHRRVSVRSWKAPIAFAVVTGLVALLYIAVPRAGSTTFRLASARDLFQLPDITVPAMATAWFTVVVMAAVLAWSVVLTRSARPVPRWTTAVFGVAFLIGFLAWAAAGSARDLSVVGLLGGAILLSVPIVYGALGGVIGERAGVVNIAIEGQLLAAAFGAAVVGTVTHNPYAGLVAAVVSGMLVALVLGLFTITYKVNQVIVGVVLNVLVIGITSFLYSQVLVPNTESFNSTTRFARIAIPGLERIPVIGPVLFNQTIVVYLMFVAVPVIWFALYRTRWGLRLRSVGEHPQAADTVGIKVERTRYRSIVVAGAIAGLGGSFYTVVSIDGFNKEMTAGAGFIALAAVIFGKWDPVRAAFAALLFGFASNLQSVLQVVGSPVPSQFMLMVPYVVTILAVAGLVGRSRPPAASGTPYIKE